jgi:glycosyltransferase involved in cell wall biosynthesis
VRAAVWTPLPPARTGVAHYASLLLPALGQHVDLVPADAEAIDRHVYQLGNNPFHEEAYRAAMRAPGVVVLHDLVLHHLIVEMTIARGDVEGYVQALEASHGPAGAAWARGRAIGLHAEIGNFLLPASVDAAQRANAVIVHNEYARQRLLSFGVTTPIHVVPHPYAPETRRFDRDALRAKLGLESADRAIGFFGFLTAAKRAEVVLEAFRIARARDPRLKLLIVGEPAPNIAVPSGEGIITTGYVEDDEFPAYYAAADRLVNLRYPTAGETSGTLIRALDAGKPVAVSNYAQFAEFPDDCVFKVPLGEGEVERLVEFFIADLPDPSRAQREWLEKNATLEAAVNGYLRALRGDGVRGEVLATPSFLFPQLGVISIEPGRVTLRNDGRHPIRTRTYGEPELRIIAGEQWLALPRDLAPGETAVIETRGLASDVRFALQGVPDVR